ncbi:MAG: gluconate 2-dehydrogenase subunit 3 family protein [Povalibacter sp.]
MNRRELLQQVAYLMGGAVSAPTLLGLMSGCSAKQSAPGWKPAFLSEEQGALVSEVAEMMIPRTDTPGAKDVGVPEFIDKLLNDVYDKEGQQRYLNGIDAFEKASKDQFGKTFMKLDSPQRLQLVQKFHDEAVQRERADTEPNRAARRPFILMTKEMTLLGFFTSQVGATQVLQYDPVPGKWQACIPLSKAGNGHSWAPEGPPRF